MKHSILYLVLIVVNAGLLVFAQQLGAGHVPIPQSWQWVVPIVGAMVTALTALLPKLGD